MNADAVNALFELVGALFTFKNFMRVREDKGYAGIYAPAIVFFTSWGLWNVFYYPHLGQWISFTAGCFLVIANTCWISACFYYGRKK